MSHAWGDVPLPVLMAMPGQDTEGIKEKIRQNEEQRPNAPWRRQYCMRSSKYYRKLNKAGRYELHNSQSTQETA